MGEHTTMVLLCVCGFCIITCGYMINGAIIYLWKSVMVSEPQPLGWAARLLTAFGTALPFGMLLLFVLLLLAIVVARAVDIFVTIIGYGELP